MACNKEKSCVMCLLVQYCKYHYILYCSYYDCPNSIPDVFLSILGLPFLSIREKILGQYILWIFCT